MTAVATAVATGITTVHGAAAGITTVHICKSETRVSLHNDIAYRSLSLGFPTKRKFANPKRDFHDTTILPASRLVLVSPQNAHLQL